MLDKKEYVIAESYRVTMLTRDSIVQRGRVLFVADVGICSYFQEGPDDVRLVLQNCQMKRRLE